MDKACELINKIQDFDKNIHQLTEVYEHSNFIMDEIVLAASYSEIDLRVCQNLKDYLNGVVQTKLNHYVSKRINEKRHLMSFIF